MAPHLPGLNRRAILARNLKALWRQAAVETNTTKALPQNAEAISHCWPASLRYLLATRRTCNNIELEPSP